LRPEQRSIVLPEDVLYFDRDVYSGLWNEKDLIRRCPYLRIAEIDERTMCGRLNDKGGDKVKDRLPQIDADCVDFHGPPPVLTSYSPSKVRGGGPYQLVSR
jgi:hypothetical protein